MNGFQVVGAYRVDIDKPMPHQHLIALGVVEGGRPTLAPTHVWTVDDVENDGGWTTFAFNQPAMIHASVQKCHLCGALHLGLEPQAVTKSLPECLVDNASSRLGKFIQPAVTSVS